MKKPEKVIEDMRGALEFMNSYSEVEGSVRVFRNRDGTVDGELRIPEIPRGTSALQMIESLQTGLDLPPGQWASIEFILNERLKPDAAKCYKRQGSTRRIPLYYVKGKRLPLLFNAAAEVAERFQNRHRLKISGGVVFRLHWNEKNKRPER